MMSRVAGTLSLLMLLAVSATAFGQQYRGYGMPPGMMGGGSGMGLADPRMGGPGGPGGPPMGGPGYGPAGAGMNGVNPAAYQAGHVEGAMAMPMEGGGCPDGCDCGGPGCGEGQGPCGTGEGYDGRYGLLGDCHGFHWLRYFAPDGDGGTATLRWFDVSADFLLWKREHLGGNRVLSTEGSRLINPAAPVALQTSDLNFNFEPAFRLMFNYQIATGSSLEFVYFGPFNWANTRTANSANNLFSTFSNFGVTPPGGFLETDGVPFQSLGYSTQLDSFELDYRYRWQAPNGRFQGSWLAGARYLKIDEDLLFRSVAANGAAFESLTNTNNSLTGGQLGGDVWICPIAGLRIGVEGKVGIYGNYTRSGSAVRTFTPAGALNAQFLEDVNSTDAAFVGQLDLLATYRINYHWTFRAGYSFLAVEGISLATDTFNPVNPFTNPPRPTVINHNGDAFYHGANFGLEYLW